MMLMMVVAVVVNAGVQDGILDTDSELIGYREGN